jgi:hypothetical protein
MINTSYPYGNTDETIRAPKILPTLAVADHAPNIKPRLL